MGRRGGARSACCRMRFRWEHSSAARGSGRKHRVARPPPRRVVRLVTEVRVVLGDVVGHAAGTQHGAESEWLNRLRRGKGRRTPACGRPQPRSGRQARRSISLNVRGKVWVNSRSPATKSSGMSASCRPRAVTLVVESGAGPHLLEVVDPARPLLGRGPEKRGERAEVDRRGGPEPYHVAR